MGVICIAINIMLFLGIPAAIFIIFRHPERIGLAPRARRLPPYGQSYHKQLVAEYNSLPERQIHEGKLPKHLLDIEHSSQLSWDDVFELDLYVLHHVPQEKLERKAWLIRQQYKAIAGKEVFESYRRSRPPAFGELRDDEKAVTSSPAQLQEDLEVVLKDIYWLYRIRTAWEENRDWVSMIIGVMVLGAAIVLAGIVIARNEDCTVEGVLPLYEVIIMGSTGGLVSLWRRLQAVPSEERRLESVIEFEHGRHTIISQSFLSGGIFAFVLLFIFMSGLAKGGAFPEFNSNGIPILDALEKLSDDALNLTKLLTWSFIAGFGERFVPDFLDRLAGSVRK